MTKDKKICPIMSNKDPSGELIDCQQEKCQWWAFCKFLGDTAFINRIAIKLDIWADEL